MTCLIDTINIMTDTPDYLSDYNPAWPLWFAEINRYLRHHLPHFLAIEHIGSTSIAGMAAKPIIDIDRVVAAGQMTATIEALTNAGYTHQGDLGIVGREAFKQVGEAAYALPAHHLYACEQNSIELQKHISFRDYLRTHSNEASRLSELKRRLAWTDHLSRAEYIEAKGPAVQDITQKALAWHVAKQANERHN